MCQHPAAPIVPQYLTASFHKWNLGKKQLEKTSVGLLSTSPGWIFVNVVNALSACSTKYGWHVHSQLENDSPHHPMLASFRSNKRWLSPARHSSDFDIPGHGKTPLTSYLPPLLLPVAGEGTARLSSNEPKLSICLVNAASRSPSYLAN